MTDFDGQLTLWGPGSRGGIVRMPSPPPSVAPQKPVWSRLVLKAPPACFACVRGLHATFGDKTTPYVPPRHAKWRRTTGDVIEDFCNQCADEQKAAELAAERQREAEKLAASRPTRRRGKPRGSGR